MPKCAEHIRANFNWVSKVIRDCIDFALLCSVIGAEKSRHSLNQSDACKTKKSYDHAFGGLVIFNLSSHWPLKVFSSLLIGHCDNFGF